MKKKVKSEDPKIIKIRGISYIAGNGVKMDLKTFLKIVNSTK